MKLRRIAIRTGGGLAATAALALLALLWLTATDGGLRALLHWSAPALSAELARGSLLGGLTLDGARIEGGGLRLEADRLTLRWRPAALLAGRLRFDELAARGVNLRWRDDGTGGATPLPPLALVVDRLAVDGLHLDIEGETVDLRRLELAAHGTLEHLRLERWSLDADGLAAEGEGTLTLAPEVGLDQRLRWSATPAGHPRWAGTARLGGDLDRLELTLEGEAPQPFRVRLAVDAPTAAARWRATVEGPSIDPSRLAPDWPALPLSLTAQLDGDLRHARVDTLTARRENGTTLTLRGRIEAPWDAPRLALEGEWTRLGWPLEAPADYLSERGGLTLDGPLDAYRLTLAGDLRGGELPPGEWRLSGAGDLAGLRFERVEGELLGGRVAGDAALGWAPRLSWRARLSGAGLDPARQWPRWPGDLAADAGIEGDEQGFTLRIDRLKGRLRGHPLDASATLRGAGDRLTLDHGRLAAADNRLALAGRIAPEPELNWSVEAPHLEALLPDAAGALHGEGRLTGQAGAPTVIGQLHGERLRYLDHRVDRLTLDAALDPRDRRPSRFRLALAGLVSPALPFNGLTAEGHGTPDDHRLELTADGDARVRIAMAGGLHDARWSGHLESLSWSHPDTGEWRSEAPAAVTVTARAQRLAPFCLAGPGRLCLEWSRPEDGAGRLTARLTGFPARLPLKRFEVASDATLDGRLTLDEAGDGQLALNAGAGVLRHAEAGLPEVVVHHGEGRLNARLRHRRLDLETKLGLGELGALDGELVVEPATDTAAPPLRGALTLTLNRLDWLSAPLPQLAAIDGHLDARLQLGGTLERPLLKGSARLEAASAELPEQGIRLTGVKLHAEGDGDGPLRLSGEAASGEGGVRLDGRLRPERPWRGELTVTGEGFEAIDTAEARVVIDPDLRLRFGGEVARLDGRLAIPEARITPHSLEGTVSASRDVELVGRPAERRGPRIDSDLVVELGERVRVTAAGFDGGLQGRVRWWESEGQPPRAEGELTTRDAEYRLYGQRLAVDSGRLRFTGGPADNPELDLTATRQSGEVTAGAHVRGALREPRLTLFSEPAMNQSDTLSYLLFGRPGDRLSGSEGELLLTAAAGLFSGGGDGPIRSIGQALGLDEARIRGDDGIQSSALVLGKYLSPRLYLGYAAGLFEPSGKVELSYRLSDRWELKSESGTTGSGADLLFTLER